jgi:hypothetical protein
MSESIDNQTFSRNTSTDKTQMSNIISEIIYLQTS